MSFGGHVIEDVQLFDPAKIPGLTSDAIETIRRVSADAFMVGMDRAIIFSGVGIMLASVLSYFLIKDNVVEDAAPDPAAAPERELVAQAAD